MSSERRNHRVAVVAYHQGTVHSEAAITVGHELALADWDFARTEMPAETKRRPTTFNPVIPITNNPYQAGGRLDVIGDKTLLGLLFYKMFGAATVTGASDPYTHKWIVGDTEPGLLTLANVDYLNSGKEDRANDVVLTGFSIDGEKSSSELVVSFDALGSGMGADDQTALDSSPTTYTSSPLSMAKSYCAIDGSNSTRVTRVSIKCQRAAHVPPVMNQQLYNEVAIVGGWNISLEITGVWAYDATDLRASLANGSEHSVKLGFPATSGTHELYVLFPEARFFRVNKPTNTKDDAQREISMTGTVYYENASEASSMLVGLVCATAAFNNTLWTT